MAAHPEHRRGDAGDCSGVAAVGRRGGPMRPCVRPLLHAGAQEHREGDAGDSSGVGAVGRRGGPMRPCAWPLLHALAPVSGRGGKARWPEAALRLALATSWLLMCRPRRWSGTSSRALELAAPTQRWSQRPPTQTESVRREARLTQAGAEDSAAPTHAGRPGQEAATAEPHGDGDGCNGPI